MRKSSAFALALALSLPLAPIAASAYDPGAAKNVDVRFKRGTTDATYQGQIRGLAYHNYRFYAQKGQVLNVDLGESHPDLDLSIRYLGKEAADFLSPQDQVLPYTGPYEVRVLQTRNGARKGNQARPYAMVISITGKGTATAPSRPAATKNATGFDAELLHAPWISYRCASGKQMEARYHFGEAAAGAEIEVGDQTLAMKLDNQQSDAETHVFTGGGYRWRVDNQGTNMARAGAGFLTRSKAGADEIIRKDCAPVRR
ncbi:MAG: hypothetical protein Q4G39_01230 [Brachymonas sp.]|nr:hypothetical protein [Brachymonas sp.]